MYIHSAAPINHGYFVLLPLFSGVRGSFSFQRSLSLPTDARKERYRGELNTLQRRICVLILHATRRS